MPQTVKGVIARSKGAPVELAGIVIPDPGHSVAVIGIGDVEQAFERMHAGEVLRSVVVL